MAFDPYKERAAQAAWIKQHGGDLEGYKLRYGDPHMGGFWYGDGGVAIYQADMDRLYDIDRLCVIEDQKRGTKRKEVHRICLDFASKVDALEFFKDMQDRDLDANMTLVLKDSLHDKGKLVHHYLVRKDNGGSGVIVRGSPLPATVRHID